MKILTPTKYLNQLTQEWALIEALFRKTAGGPVHQNELLLTIKKFKIHDDETPVAVLEKLKRYGILNQPVESESRYTISGLVHHIASELLREQRLGIPGTIQAHIDHLTRYSQELRQTAETRSGSITHPVEQISNLVLEVKNQAAKNLFAITNLVAKTKQEVRGEIRQYYLKVIDVWEHYIEPLGQMIDVNGPFRAALKQAAADIEQAIALLKETPGLMSEEEKPAYLLKMIEDVKWTLLSSYSEGKKSLQPLYEIARLNSQVTQGAAAFLEAVSKSNISSKSDEFMTDVALPFFRRSKYEYLPPDRVLSNYYVNIKDSKDAPPPQLPSEADCMKHQAARIGDLALLDKDHLITKASQSLPISDIAQWVIDDYLAGQMRSVDLTLAAIFSLWSTSLFKISIGPPQKYHTHTHKLTMATVTAERQV